MSVFTPVSHDALQRFVQDYPLGRLLAFQGIEGGSENSNFFVTLEQGEFVLTLVERPPVAAELPFFTALLERLHQAGLAVPFALPGKDGACVRPLAGRLALLQPRLLGSHVVQPNTHHCAELGHWLAGLHLATQDQPLEHPSDRGWAWMLSEGPRQALYLPHSQLPTLRQALAAVALLRKQQAALPQANLHADLFRDNVLFEGGHLAGVIDFYNACSGPMLYDLAIALNDWCQDEPGVWVPARVQALLGSYSARRPFTVLEAELWPLMCQAACLRFWLSRLVAAQEHAGQDVLIKDPDAFYQCLQHPVGMDLPLTF